MECPKCGIDISDTYQPAEPDVGIMSDGWFCYACDVFVEKEYEYREDDVSIFGTTKSDVDSDFVVARPCACGFPYEPGYGLAGGPGLGSYMYCPKCHAIMNKEIDRL